MRSIRSHLLAWVLLPLVSAVALDAAITRDNALTIATVVQDRLLVGAARVIAEQLRFEDGGVRQHIPPSALALFAAGSADRVYYRVSTSAGLLLAGYDDLGAPAQPLLPETPHYFDTRMRGQPLRAVALWQPVVGEPHGQPVLVVVAQTLRGHGQMASSLWGHAVGQQLLILALATVLILLGLRRGLRPLLALRDAVLARRPNAIQPLPADPSAPAELAPLVDAINHYMARLETHAGTQEVFIQNAAHQLRTPLTLLNTQLSFALRTPDSGQRDESLAAMRRTVQQAIRLVHQLLTLSAAQAQASTPTPSQAALNEVAQQVLEDLAAQAQAKRIDIGLELLSAGPWSVAMHPVTLRELLTNLVDNALRYTPVGGIVTLRLESLPQQLLLTVEDNGPGIDPALRERVFERFFRIDDRDSDGCGLGLAIVREYARQCGASLSLETPAGGAGLAVRVALPRAEPPAEYPASVPSPPTARLAT